MIVRGNIVARRDHCTKQCEGIGCLAEQIDPNDLEQILISGALKLGTAVVSPDL